MSVGQLLGRGAVVDALEAHEPPLLLLARRDDGEPVRAGEQTRAPGASRSTRSVTKRDVQLALHTVGTADAPDLSKWSVDKVDVDLDAIAGGRGAHDGANALCSAATTADDSAEIAGADLHFELQTIPALDGIHLHSIGIVDDRATRTWVSTRWPDRRRDSLALSTVGVSDCVAWAGRSLAGRSLGCPGGAELSHRTRHFQQLLDPLGGLSALISHFTALALSMLSVDGSVRGL